MRSFLTFDFATRDPDHPSSPQNLEGAALKYVLENGNFPLPKRPEDDTVKETKSTGAGEKWFVKGGSFQFRIASDFAISDANIALSSQSIKDLTAAAKAKNQDPPKGPFVRAVASSTTPIFSKPMHVPQNLTDAKSKITSTLAVTVANKDTDDVIDAWDSVKLVAKDVPTAIWAAYDPALDPGKKPAALLNGDNATVKQCMTLMLTAPPPFLSPPPELKGFIPKFKATAAARFEVRDFRTSTDEGTAWFVPGSETLQTMYLPRELTDREKAQANQDR